jgi:hypothetical protein
MAPAVRYKKSRRVGSETVLFCVVSALLIMT